MKAIIVSDDHVPTPPTHGGAIGLWTFQFAKELSKHGYEVHLLGIANPEIDYEASGIIFHTIPFPSYMKTWLGRKLGSISRGNYTALTSSLHVAKILNKVDRKDVAFIQTHYFTTSLPSLFFDANLKIRIWHNLPRRSFINKIIAKKFDLIGGVSNFLCKKVVETLNADPHKVVVIPDFVDTEFMRPSSNLREIYRQKLQLNEDSIVALYVGRIIPKKGLHHLLIVLKKLSEKIGVDVKLLVVGPKGYFDSPVPTYSNYLVNLISSLRLHGKIIWLGNIHIKHMCGIYNASDIVVIPTLAKEGGVLLTTLEAMACGKPVVAYDNGAISEAVLNNKTGLVVKQADINMLFNALLLLVENPNLCKKFGQHGRTYCERNFDLRKVVERAIKIYTSVGVS